MYGAVILTFKPAYANAWKFWQILWGTLKYGEVVEHLCMHKIFAGYNICSGLNFSKELGLGIGL